MLLSQLKQILMLTLTENAERILGRKLKNYEVVNFFNLHEEQLEIIMQKTSHEFQMFINEYIENMK